MRYLLIIPFIVGCSILPDRDKELLEEWVEAELNKEICENAGEVLIKHCTDLKVDDPKNILCDKLESNYMEKCI